MNWLDVLAAAAARGTIILLAAGAAALCLRRSSAAVRHCLWTAALSGLLLLPFAQRLAPRWTLPFVPPASLALATTGESASAATITVHGQASHPVPWPLLIWILGAAGAAVWFLLGFARVRRIIGKGAPAEFAFEPPVRVLVSEAALVPMACGVWRPCVVLPAAAREWSPARLRAVLLHEVTHIQRNDLLTQILGQIACCLYWFHPLAWLAARQLSIERERACDDAVLANGITATDYATHLMELARALGGRAIHAPAMAESSNLEARVRALLERGRNRRPLNRKAAFAIASALVAILLPLAALHAQAPATPVSSAPAGPIMLAGIVQDPTNARVPGCAVTARSLDGPGSTELTTQTDAIGVYRFAGLPPGRYALQFSERGFARMNRAVTIAAGQPAELDVTLVIGSVQESVTVKGQRSAADAKAPASAAQPRRIRVGGNVQPARLFEQTRPVYSPELQQQGVVGLVVIKASIAVTGEPVNLKVISPGSDPRLAQAALDAVRQWRYQPALLNGEPVPIDTQITVDFRLDP